MSELRVGVSGVGSIGSRHARLLVQIGVRDLVLYDRQPAGLDLPPAVAGAVWVASFAELLERGLDGIVVATPEESHLEQVQAACEAGVPVLVEKPLAGSVRAAAQLEDVAAATGTAVLVGYVLRYATVMRRARELLAGSLGAVRSVHVALGAGETVLAARSRFSTPTSYRIVFDYSHEWDYLEWLLGPIRRVAAFASGVPSGEARQHPDVVDGLIEFERGCGGTFHLDYLQHDGGRVVSFVGERAALVLDAGRGRLDLRALDGRFTRGDDCAEPRDAMFMRQLEHFIAVVRGDERPSVGVADGRRAVEIAEAIREASEEGRWVELPSASARRPAAVDHQVDARDVGGGVRGEKDDRALDVLRARQAAERHP